tara:strand:+ start:211 stop:801 length:591 start_codon:yes stop_codon:yes gene_type:complete
MAKRTSRKRLFALNKLGQPQTQTAGTAFGDAIGNQTELREGALVTTDITIDLGSSLGALNSFATVGAGTGANRVVGVSSSSGTHGNAQILLLDNAVHGYAAEVELICVEAPTTGEDNLGIWYGTNISASNSQLNSGGTELIAAAVQSVGIVGANVAIDADLGGKYLYLASSGSTAGTYAAGKFILRVYGYPVFDDV